MPWPRLTLHRLDGRAQRYALAGAAVCAGLVAGLATEVRRSRAVLPIDLAGDRLARAHVLGVSLVPLHLANRYLTLGTNPGFAVAVAGLVLLGLTLGDTLVAVIALVAPPLALALTEWVTKPLVGRREFLSIWVPLRPNSDVGRYGFPSGHTTAAAALAVVAALLAWRRWGRPAVAVVVPIVVLVPLAMTATVVRLRTHVLSDALGGVAVGYATVLVAIAVAAHIEQGRLTPRPPPRAPAPPMPASAPRPG